jgi:hypothetical protein
LPALKKSISIIKKHGFIGYAIKVIHEDATLLYITSGLGLDSSLVTDSFRRRTQTTVSKA